MHPVTCKNLVIAALALGNLILMMWENKIFPTCMNVDLFTKIFLRHYRALYMPARTSFAPWRFPVRFAFFFWFPKHKIQGIFFLIFTRYLKCTETRLEVIQILMGQLSVLFKFLYPEIYGTIICCICIAFIH